jgi:putative methyltransferase (TIGR04325 family)
MFATLTPALLDSAGQLPVVGPLLQRIHWSRFCAARGVIRRFHGIYADFATARRAIPPDRLEGYDNEPSATLLADERLRVIPLDYPILFWLEKLLPCCRLLFDFGGNVGISYFGFRKYLSYPAQLTWLVEDVPAVVQAGKRLARAEGASQLQFTTTLDELPGADILLALGSLHFIDDPISALRALPALPPHILLNKVPVGDRPAIVTLHNTGAALCPYNLFNRAEFVGAFQSMDYELVDQWETPDLGIRIPLHRDHSLRSYSGFYFRAQHARAAAST